MRFLSRSSQPIARIVSLSVVPFTLALAASSVLVQNTPLVAQESTSYAPETREVIILSMNDETATISEGDGSGVRVGSIFTLSDGGVVRAKLRVTAVRNNDSTAQLFDVERDFLVTVGDKAQYFTYEAPAMAEASPTPAPQIVAPTPRATPTSTPTPVNTETPENVTLPVSTGTGANTGNTSGGETVTTETTTTETVTTQAATPEVVSTETPTPSSTQAVPVASGWTNVRVTNIEGSKVTLGAGLNEGIKTGVNLPVWQDGSVVAILRVLSSQGGSSTAQLTWSDVAAGGLNVGDIVRIENTVINPNGSAPGTGTNSGVLLAGGANENRPSSPVAYESGASDFSVPRADRTYEYLAALATSGLIQSQPADTFQDDGFRRHRTEEDIILTRAQIAAFVKEALDNAEESVSGRDDVALAFLANEYSKDLRALGITQERIAQVTGKSGFKLGVSGLARLTFGGAGAKDGETEYLPFSEPKGGTRTRTGYDVRTNIFGQASKKVKFFATLDGGSRLNASNASIDGLVKPGTNDSGFELRRALLSYDASSLLKGLTVDVGRNEYWWGVGRYGTTFLGDNNALDAVHTRFARGSYSIETLYSPLGRGPAGGQRSLYARKFELKVGKQSRFGFYESLLLPAQRFDTVSLLSTFVPLPMRAVQKIRGRNTDGDQSQSVVALYGETAVARGSRIYGELLIDDLATTPDNPNRNRIGTLFGLQLFTPRDITKAGVNIEFTNLQARTYFPIQYFFDQTQDYNYFQNGASLGYPVAPDPSRIVRGGAESLRLEFYFKPIKKLRVNAGVEFVDRGSEEDVVARQQVLRLGATYNISRNYAVSARVQNLKTRNPLNVVGNGATQNFFQFQVSRSF